MFTKITINGMTLRDHFVAWTMMAGLAVAVMQLGQAAALPAHFV